MELLSDYTFRIIALGTFFLGLICGTLGSFAVLRKQSLIGDAISHAALPGIAIAFLLTGSKDPNILLLGALASGVIGVFWIQGIVTKTPLKTDTALGLVLSLFFGLGVMLLSYIQKLPNANQAGLDKFLFGQAATLLLADVLRIAIVFMLATIFTVLFWKEIKLFLFDKNFAKTLGFNFKWLDFTLSFFIVIAIVVGLQAVGVVLMSALILAPAAAARQWSNRLTVMVVLSGLLGALSGVLGTVVSAQMNNVSTGPVIVLVALSFVIVSFVFAPKRGWLYIQVKRFRNRRELQTRKTLESMYRIAQGHERLQHPHEVKILNNFLGYTKGQISRLEQKGYIRLMGTQWSLTNKGISVAEQWFNQNDTK